ncbi:GNAT family N-acetyltransferase [Mucilaginibacter lacusdianchii]|uniref:GNAT family N-acetyltransferase n=1 Tax=Mucilaginibacter lacusdianchii TaxID=2684211 RepID=UPI00131C29BC|nr:GNAT family N-acetyltransferase [Mucilaginibacter sp. JXJ CY 39]
MFLESARLKLIALNHQQLLLCRANRAALEKSLSLKQSNLKVPILFQREMAEAMQNIWLPDTLRYPDLYTWYTNWEIIDKSINTAVGSIGFGGYPDDYGETSVGYMIDQHHWGKGYATEALLTILQWGFSFSVLKTIVADTSVDNIASQKVLLKVGFKQVRAGTKLLFYKLQKRQLLLKDFLKAL